MRNLNLRFLLTVVLILAVFYPVAEAADVEALLRTMTLEEKIGQMLFPAFRTQAGKGVTQLTPEVAKSITRYQVGGVILFRENLETPDQTARLISSLQATSAKIPLFIGVDQEGGRITRIPYGALMPGNMALAATGKVKNAYLAAKAIGEQIRQLGFNVNFAPVLDINSNPENPVIGVRSFGEDPNNVAAMGNEAIRGFHAAGIAVAVKHFPGHGDTSVDSHLGLPTQMSSRQQLASRELIPFVSALTMHPDMIMTAHIALPNIEPGKVVSAKDNTLIPLPATLSPILLTGVLRQQLRYNGVIITDALNMKAVAEHFGPAEAAVRVVQAGADILLMPELEKSHSALLAAVESGKIDISRIDQSVRRILMVKAKLGMFDSAKITQPLDNKPTASDLESSLAEQAVTLLKNEGRVLPFSARAGARVLLLAPQPDQLATMRQQTEDIFRASAVSAQITALEYQGKIGDVHLSAIENSDQIILAIDSVGAISRDPAPSAIAAAAVSLASLAGKAGKPIAVMAVRNPYDLMYFAESPVYLAVYAPIQPNIAAGVRVIFGIQPDGKLPVTITGKDGAVLHPRGFGLKYNF